MFEAFELLGFCHEETAEAVERRAVGADRAVVSGAPMQAGQPWSTMGVESEVF